MDRYVHEQLTERWVREAGLDAADAAEAARWDWQVDVAWPGSLWGNRRFHHRVFGALGLAAAYLEESARTRSVPHLGVALHLTQDAIGHGVFGTFVHWKGIDQWERRSLRVRARLERATKAAARAFLAEMPSEPDRRTQAPLTLPPAPVRVVERHGLCSDEGG